MAFDRQRVLASIQKILGEIELPGSRASLVSAGCVNRVIARDGHVSLILSLPQSFAGSREEFKEAVRTRLIGVEGVEEVQVLEKASAPSPAPEAAQPQPVLAGGSIPGVRHLIAVASGKGGVGKSTVAVNLAVALAKRGLAVGLLDSDVYGPSIPKMLGLEGQHPRATAEDRLIPLEAHGLRTMSIGFMLDDDSPVIWRGPMVTGLLRQFLNQVDWGELDYLIIDLPPGTGDAQLTLVQTIALTAGIIVTTPQDVALLDVQRGIQMFKRVDVPIFGIVENMSIFECPHCGRTTEIFRGGGGEAAARRYGVPYLGSIPIVSQYALAGDRGDPVVASNPDSELARVIHSAATRLVEEFPV